MEMKDKYMDFMAELDAPAQPAHHQMQAQHPAAHYPLNAAYGLPYTYSTQQQQWASAYVPPPPPE
jgi:hypothetical protein